MTAATRFTLEWPFLGPPGLAHRSGVTAAGKIE